MARAKTLANMSDTSFISYEEEKQYLDTAWQNVYQKAINKGCKYWLKEVFIAGQPGVYYLPEDFYQLCSIRDPFTGLNVERKAESESNASLSYELINNCLTIYGRSCRSNLVVSYWPKPKSLTFPAKDIVVSGLTKVPLDYWRNIIVVSDGFYDVNTETYTAVEWSEMGDTVYVGEHFFAVLNAEHTLSLINKSMELLETVTDVNQILRDEEGVFYYIKGTTLYRENGTVVLEDIDDAVQTNTLGAICKGDVYYYQVHLVDDIITNCYVIDDNIIIDSGNLYATVYDGSEAIINNNVMYWLDEDVWLSYKLKDYFRIGGYCGKNNFRAVYDGNSVILNSFVPDTELDYPNNLLFEVLAYSLAHSYMLKMDAPVDSILTALSQATETFFDSLDDDAAGYTRIKNVY